MLFIQSQRYGLFRLMDHPWSQGFWITEVPLYVAVFGVGSFEIAEMQMIFAINLLSGLM